MLLELYSDQKDDATTQENVVIPPAPGKSATEKEFASLSDLDPLSKIHINAEIEVEAAAVEANEMSLGYDQLEVDFDMKSLSITFLSCHRIVWTIDYLRAKAATL